nr:MAG TPA: hypothetical protein [Caudoviricetes sp.]
MINVVELRLYYIILYILNMHIINKLKRSWK